MQLTRNMEFSCYKWNIQFYNYAENIVEEGQPFREGHLEHILKYVNNGACI